MFERFTEQARRVVDLAQDEAMMLSHRYIGTEHLVLALIRDGDGPAARALVSLGIGLDRAREQIEQIAGPGNKPPAAHLPFTLRARQVLSGLAQREALQFGSNEIGAEHILLAIVRTADGAAAQLLGRLGADLSTVRRRINAQLRAPGDSRQHGARHEQPAGIRSARADSWHTSELLARIDSLYARLPELVSIAGTAPGLTALDQRAGQARHGNEAAAEVRPLRGTLGAPGLEPHGAA